MGKCPKKKLHTARLREVRACYLFMCFTGYAYKDASMLTPQNVMPYIDGNEWVVKNREKTWCRENVPLLPIAKEIIERYKDQDMNKLRRGLVLKMPAALLEKPQAA